MDLAPLPALRGDADALLRVVQNLVTNAVQAIDGHGVVTLRTFEQDGKAVLSVADTGCGMSEDFVRTSLFAPFRSTKKGGWGIGLYQARGIVEAHGGCIEVSSKKARAPRFSISSRSNARTQARPSRRC
jgi:signal transduction histidine kinase